MLFNEQDHIEVQETVSKGKSLFAKHDFKKGDVVFVATGKIVTYPTDYTIPINESLYIEPRYPGSLAQFICHSCDPNVGVNNRNLFVAIRDINKGEEILTSYAFLGYEYGNEKSPDGKEKLSLDITCNCGAKNCSGELQRYKHMTPEWRKQYHEYISEYLRDDSKYPYVGN